MSYTTEKEAATDLRDMLAGHHLPFEEQVLTKSGKRIDFVVELPNMSRYKIGIECKKSMDETTNATVLANYLEQAHGYARDLEMPVFLGPVVTAWSPSECYHGSHKLSAMAALNIFGGRINVGTVVKQVRYSGTRWFVVYRGALLWDSQKGVNEKKTFLVTSTGSKAERSPMRANIKGETL
jgi:hypothetical protein